jgi:putative tricarboxylic transport membrane protein
VEALTLLGHGFALLLTPKYLLFCFTGVLLGQVIGVLPGIGPAAGIAVLLPLTFGGDPTASVTMFAGIYYGAYYGGTITSVLVRIPGEAATVMTSLDGYELARQGRAGAALGIAAIASFIAGTVSALGLTFAAPALARGALAFGPQEYLILVVMGLCALALVGGSLLKGLIMGVLGLCLATIGVDPQIGNPRFTFGQLWLLDGIEFLVLAVAFFGIGEVLASAADPPPPVEFEAEVTSVYPTLADWVATRWAILRGTVIGFFIGVLPGAGATIASFIAYAVEKKVSKTPERFGKGAIEAVAAPEAANNSASIGAMVPMFALGIPGSNTTAIMLGALIMFGLRPGPALFEQNPDFVWTVVASLYLGNVILLVLNLPLVGLFARIAKAPYALLYPVILALCIAGVYSQSNSMTDLWFMCGFGVVGFFMKRYDYPAAPLVLGLVLEPLFENALRQSMTLSHGSLSFVVTRPLALGLLLVTAGIVFAPFLVKFVRVTLKFSRLGT